MKFDNERLELEKRPKSYYTENGNLKMFDVCLIIFGLIVLGIAVTWAQLNGVILQ